MADETLRFGAIVLLAPVAFGFEIRSEFRAAQAQTSSGTPCSLHHQPSWLCSSAACVVATALSGAWLQPIGPRTALAANSVLNSMKCFADI